MLAMLIYIFRKTNYHKTEIVIRNSRCFQTLHNSSASGHKRFEILYLQNGIAFTCCAISFKTIDRFQLKNSQSGGLNVKARGWLKSFLVCFQKQLGMDRIDFRWIIILSPCGMNETFFFSIKFTQQIQENLLDFSYVERTDFFVERTDHFVERSDY